LVSVAGSPRKFRTLWPLPGGTGSYLASAAKILAIITAAEDTGDAVDELVAQFPGVRSKKAALSYLRVLVSLGLVNLDGPKLLLTREGHEFFSQRDPTIIKDALIRRISGVEELLNILRINPGLRIGLLVPHLRAIGYEWTTYSQVRYRLLWLQEVGVVERTGRARQQYRFVGTAALARI
jgi:hypothetical protein